MIEHAGWQRWVVFVFCTLGVALATYDLIVLSHATQEVLRLRLYDGIDSITCIAMFVICWMIAWRGGDSTANLAIALAFTVAFLNDAASVFFMAAGRAGTAPGQIVNTLTFVIAAGLFIRATQNFPMRLTAERLAGQRALIALLRPAVMWPVISLLSLVATLAPWRLPAALGRLCIIVLGIAYFFASYRRCGPEARRKVLWFLAAAIAAAAASVLAILVRYLLDLGDDESALRTVVGVGFQVLNSVAFLTCFSAAVFYAGAISPSLVIRKTVVYGATTLLLLFAFASVEVFIHHEIVHYLHVTDTFASSLIGGGFGLAFHPVKHYFERLLARMQGRHVLEAAS